jgi:hypothetical protein
MDDPGDTGVLGRRRTEGLSRRGWGGCHRNRPEEHYRLSHLLTVNRTFVPGARIVPASGAAMSTVLRAADERLRSGGAITPQSEPCSFFLAPASYSPSMSGTVQCGSASQPGSAGGPPAWADVAARAAPIPTSAIHFSKRVFREDFIPSSSSIGSAY